MSIEAIIEVVILGIVQGIAEFLPISSSGHLTIAAALMQSGSQPGTGKLALNIALHAGTLFSILVIFRKDVLNLLKTPSLLISIFIATIPAVVVGFTLKDQIEALFDTPLIVGFCLLVTAGLLWLTLLKTTKEPPEKEPTEKEPTGDSYDAMFQKIPNWKIALLIGAFQAIAILPGISRSGSTIVAGLLLGLSRSESARYSFLMAIPVIGGATLLLIKDLVEAGDAGTEIPLLLLGAFVSFLVGIVALKWLLAWLKKGRLHWFAYYCATVGIATICWQLLA